MGSRARLRLALGALEQRLRVRMHQAGNRREDYDPVDIAVARWSVRVLDRVDRVVGFRAAHRAATEPPEGERLPTPPVVPTPHPEWDGLDGAALTARQRIRLRQTYRQWRAHAADDADAREAEAEWRRALAEIRASRR